MQPEIVWREVKADSDAPSPFRYHGAVADIVAMGFDPDDPIMAPKGFRVTVPGGDAPIEILFDENGRADGFEFEDGK